MTLVATGSGAKDANGLATDGDINARGTQITAQDVTLNAARDVNLQSAHDKTKQNSSNSSSSASIGVGFGLGGTQNGFTLELAASAAKGNANGNSVTNRDTQISAGNTVSITSGRDTNLRGAEVSGNTVDANVGRDLNIASQQDTNTYNSQQTSAGFQASVCVPPFCYGQTVSGSANVSDQTIKDNFHSVNRQSGIQAGSGGYNINVGNHTHRRCARANWRGGVGGHARGRQTMDRISHFSDPFRPGVFPAAWGGVSRLQCRSAIDKREQHVQSG